MFEQVLKCPIAVASQDSDGVAAAIEWCAARCGDDETITIWTHLVGGLEHEPLLTDLLRFQGVEHVAARGGWRRRDRGPLLMAWPDLEAIGDITRNARHCTALCVISWNDSELAGWVALTRPEILGDGSSWDATPVGLDLVAAGELTNVTGGINHNNVISAGYEKDRVISALLAMRQAGIPMNADAMKSWAVVHGWSGDNAKRLAGYVDDINAGKRPRTRHPVRREHVAELRRQAAARRQA